MSRYLIVTWDGAGNLVPTLGITRTLVERGHDVRLLGHDTIAERCADTGARFVPLTQGEGWDAMEDPDDFEAEVKLLIEDLCFSRSSPADLATELDREPADAVLVDCMLFTAIDVALARGVPTAALFHTPYSMFRGGQLVEMFAPGLAIANAHRAQLGLPAVETARGHPRRLRVCDRRAAEGVRARRAGRGERAARRAGPRRTSAGPRIDEVDIRDGSTPLVLVSLSTSEQGQADLLQRCVDAVAQLPVRALVTTGPSIDPASVTPAPTPRWCATCRTLRCCLGLAGDHPRGGRNNDVGTRHGVPLLCTPMGRDQFFNAEQVEVLGAGRMLMPDSSSEVIAQAAADVLEDDRFKAGAKQLAVAISGYGGAAQAAATLEELG